MKAYAIDKQANIKKIPMFATANDTTQWCLAIDGLFKLYDTQAEAAAIYDLIGEIGDSPYGSVQLIPPGHRPKMHPAVALSLNEPEDMTRCLLSDCLQTDLTYCPCT